MKESLRIPAILGLIAFGMLACGQEAYLKRVPVEPVAFYCLTFEVDPVPAAGDEVRWVLHQFTLEGEQPFDGTFEGEWQRLVPGQTRYRHAFLTTDDAAEVGFRLRAAGTLPKVTAVTLEPVVVTNLVLNGDFSLGAGNQSGWSEMRWAAVIGEGDTNLLQVNQNGYALTDYFPVEGGGGYDFMRGAKQWPGVRLLAYDRQRRLIGPVSRVRTNQPPLHLPAEAAYARILFNTSHDHIPSFCTNRIFFTGLVRQGDAPPSVRAADPLPRAGEEIILAPGSDAREIYAARELRHWIAQITGRRPPLLAAPSPRRNTKLAVGAAQAGAFAEDLAWLQGSDGYAVRRRGETIHVFGAKPRGTIFGVHAFLERNSDILWPRPHPDFEAIWTPQSTLAFADADFRSRPVFDSRHISRSTGDYRFQAWMARNGLNTDFRLHTGFDYLLWEHGAPAVYGNSHIGWIGGAADRDNTFYPLVDGARSLSRWRQPCYTHPETATTIAAAIRRALALVPEQPVEHVSSIIADNWSVCACERCLQPIRLPDGSLLDPRAPYANQDSLFFSTRNFIMLNAVAEDLARDYPNLRLITHAYIFTAEPPRVKLHPMIVPQFAAYPTQNARFPIRAGRGLRIDTYTPDVWKRRFEAWGRWKPDGLGFFGYYYTPGFNALADTAAADFRDLAAMGGVQAHTEGFPHDGDALSTWDVDGAEKWVMARLMWDPDQDPARLRETFVRRVYREAAPRMMAFNALIGRAWHDTNSTLFVNCHSQIKDLYEGLLVKPGIEQEARMLLTQGVDDARHPLSRRLLQRTLDHFDLYRERAGRREVPRVDEARQEWREPGSPHWEKALVLAGFKKVDDWRRFDGASADPPTEVRFMHDGTRLYLRVTAHDHAPGALVAPPRGVEPVFPNGDRVELMIVDGRGRHRFLAAGPNGNRYASPPLEQPWEAETVIRADGWVALLALPLETFGVEAQNPVLRLRVGRVYRVGESRQESTPSGASLFNLHDSFWMQLIIQGKE